MFLLVGTQSEYLMNAFMCLYLYEESEKWSFLLLSELLFYELKMSTWFPLFRPDKFH